jgi:signal peptide peptidase SppA
MRFLKRHPTVPVLRFSGAIGMATPLRPGLSLATVSGALERAFTMSKTPAVVLQINSPGGSPVQSHLIFRRIRVLAEEHKKRVYVFAEDVCASGGYFLAVAGDEIHADPSSIVGSIGVVSAGFGFDKLIEKLGVERRVYTAGDRKATLDPFLPEQPEEVARLKALQSDVHETFKSIVRERRGPRLSTDEEKLFSGEFWSAKRAAELGLIDGMMDARARMRELFGDKVRLVTVPLARGGLLSRLRRPAGVLPDIARPSAGSAFADDIVSAIEARALWARFGL